MLEYEQEFAIKQKKKEQAAKESLQKERDLLEAMTEERDTTTTVGDGMDGPVVVVEQLADVGSEQEDVIVPDPEVVVAPSTTDGLTSHRTHDDIVQHTGGLPLRNEGL